MRPIEALRLQETTEGWLTTLKQNYQQYYHIGALHFLLAWQCVGDAAVALRDGRLLYGLLLGTLLSFFVSLSIYSFKRARKLRRKYLHQCFRMNPTWENYKAQQ
jgi:hypothetical protein